MPAKTQPARGMRDFLPADVRRREYVVGRIRETYERYGFEPLETPAVENIETLLGKYGEEGNQLIFKILRRGEHEKTGEADLALRYDLTVPLARVVAEYADKLPKFFKRYQIQPVWRADRPARGRFREFYQCDVDCIGTNSPVVEAELCAAVSDALVSLGFDDFEIRINHRQILTGMLYAAGLSEDQYSDALVAIDKLDKVGFNGVRVELAKRNISGASIDSLLQFLEATKEQAEIFGAGHGNRAILQITANSMAGYSPGLVGQGELAYLIELAQGTSAGSRIIIDPSLARGLSYYTGTIMEIRVDDLPGSLGGGGRYDNLIGMFSGRRIPACGFSLGLERIIVVMTERDMFPSDVESKAADVLIAIWPSGFVLDSQRESLALAAELRRAAPQLRVDVYPEADKLGKQFKYASSRGVPFVIVIGDQERARNEVTFKDMRTGEQRSISRAGHAIADAISVPPDALDADAGSLQLEFQKVLMTLDSNRQLALMLWAQGHSYMEITEILNSAGFPCSPANVRHWIKDAVRRFVGL